MLVVSGSVHIKPELREEAVAITTAMATASREETGCISYRFFSSVEDPDLFFAFEEWESEEALAIHFKSDHMKVFQQGLAKIAAGRVTVNRYNVESVGKI